MIISKTVNIIYYNITYIPYYGNHEKLFSKISPRYLLFVFKASSKSFITIKGSLSRGM